MPSERNYYVICDDNCRFPSLTKEQILSAIRQAVEGGEIDVDAGLVTKIREINHGANIQFWVGTQAEYNALEQHESNVLYIISDDQYKEELQVAVDNLARTVGNIATTLTGSLETLSDLSGRIEAIENDTSTMETQLSTLESDVSELQTASETISTEITEQETAINEITEDLQSLEEIDRKITESAQTVLYSANVIPSARTIELSESVDGFSKIAIIFDDSETVDESTVHRAIVGTDTFVVMLYKRTSSHEVIVNSVALHFNGNQLVIDDSSVTTNLLLTVIGIV